MPSPPQMWWRQLRTHSLQSDERLQQDAAAVLNISAANFGLDLGISASNTAPDRLVEYWGGIHWRPQEKVSKKKSQIRCPRKVDDGLNREQYSRIRREVVECTKVAPNNMIFSLKTAQRRNHDGPGSLEQGHEIGPNPPITTAG